VFDPAASPNQRVHEALKKPRVMDNLLELALWSTQNVPDAEALIADAVIVASDPDMKP
jgi:hypothetical protein